MSQPHVIPSDAPPAAGASSALEAVSRPLLRLVQHISGMETSFVTAIDWDAQRQDVLFSLNTGELQVAEAGSVDWNDSMCRSMFLAGRPASSDVGGDVTATRDAIQARMKSFVAVPILAGDHAIGTVCGASRRHVQLRDDQVEALQYIADALQQLLQAERGKTLALARAIAAEDEVRLARDTADRQAFEYQRMSRLAHTDELTGLPNRRAFMARWEDALARSGRRHYGIGILLIDADRFKNVNDTLGHLVGDDVLGGIGASLRQIACGGDIIARLGGDEFAMAVCNSDVDHLMARARSIRRHFAEIAARLGVDTTLSIGIAHSDQDARQELLGDADQALYRSKEAGGDRATAFTRGDT